MKTRTGSRWVYYLLGLAIFLFFLFNALEKVAYDGEYYRDFQRDNGISERTGRTLEELDQVSGDIILYLQEGTEELMTRNFADREVLHMKDVFQLFELERLVKLVSLILIALLLAGAFLRGEAEQAELVGRRMLTLLFVFLLLLAIAGFFFWNRIFTLLHQIFFNNDLWILDPDTDLMIQMMPAPFFMGMALRILIKTVVDIIVFMILLHLAVGLQKQLAYRQ